jgi:hypothetical protein
VVQQLGAVQAQDYLGSLWDVGLRARGATETTVEEALASRRIVRSWPLRGTLHFVAAADIPWMLELLTPRVLAASAGRRLQLELNADILYRCRALVVDALRGGRQLQRNDLYRLLANAGIATAGCRGRISCRTSHSSA